MSMYLINKLHIYIGMNNSMHHNMSTHNKKILDFVKKQKIVTSSEVAKYLKVSWNTADKYLLELVIDGKIQRIRKVGVTLWVIK